MRVAHIVRKFSAPSETFIYDMLMQLQNLEPDNHYVFVTQAHVLQNERPYPHISLQNPTILEKTANWFRQKYQARSQAAKYPPIVQSFRKELHLFKPNVLHAHFLYAAYDLADELLNGSLREVPLVITTHGSDVTHWPNKNPSYKDFLQELIKRPNTIFTVHSDFLRAQLIKIIGPAQTIFKLNNTYEKNFEQFQKRNLLSTDGQLVMINIGRLTGWKGQQYLISAFAEFHKKICKNSVLWLVGEGETRGQLEAQVSQLNIKSAVKFFGNVPHKKIPELLQQAHLYIQPSIIEPKTNQQEGVPIAVLEAAVVGLAVIVTDTGGMKEIVPADGMCSRIVAHSDAKTLFEAMRSMYESKAMELNIGDWSKEIRDRFSPDIQMRDLRHIYNYFFVGEK